MMMRRPSVSRSAYPYRTLTGWILALILGWLICCSPWSLGWNLTLATLSVLLTISSLVAVSRRRQVRQIATHVVLSDIRQSLDRLPAGLIHNTPLILAVGSPATLQATFGERSVRLTNTAIWVRATEPSQLAHLADALRDWREGQGPEACVYLLGSNDNFAPAQPQSVSQANSLTPPGASLLTWRCAISEANRTLGYSLPTGIAVYLEDHAPTLDDDGFWFGLTAADSVKAETLSELIATQLTRYRRSLPPDQAISQGVGCRTARLDALGQWLASALLSTTADKQRHLPPMRLFGIGMTAVSGKLVAECAFSRFIASRTGLTPYGVQSPSLAPAWPLPEALITGIRLHAARPALRTALAHGLIWLVFFSLAAAAASAWQNRNLVQDLHRHITLYQAIAPSHDADRVAALKILKQDRDTLERHLSEGIPLRLGLGFYQGLPWLSRINDLIAAYLPPAPLPTTIELDSMSLFSSASAALQRDANRALVGALEMIKAHPDKRVLIAGHSDSTGDAKANQKLSEARAVAVRDWLSEASGLPLPRFAIQGYGDTRPKAANDSAAGRAANRRVEITLVPDCRDQRSPGQSACSFN